MAEGISSSTTGVDYLSMIQSAATTNSSTEKTEEEEKTTEEILSELRQSGTSSTMTAQQIAEEYGISLSKAQEILQELNNDSSEEETIPENSTVSYLV